MLRRLLRQTVSGRMNWSGLNGFTNVELYATPHVHPRRVNLLAHATCRQSSSNDREDHGDYHKREYDR